MDSQISKCFHSNTFQRSTTWNNLSPLGCIMVNCGIHLTTGGLMELHEGPLEKGFISHQRWNKFSLVA